MLAISSLQVCCRNIALSYSFLMFMWILYVVFGSFSYRSKVIIKGISNIIRTGYSITIIKGEHSGASNTEMHFLNSCQDKHSTFLKAGSCVFINTWKTEYYAPLSLEQNKPRLKIWHWLELGCSNELKHSTNKKT